MKKGDRAGRERTPFILLILEKHIISLLLWLYRNKRRPFAVSNDTLFLSVQSKLTRVFLVLFAVIKKIGDSPHQCGLRPQGKPIRDRVGRVHSCHFQQGEKTLQVLWHRWLADPTTTPPPNIFFTDLHDSREWPISRWKRRISPKGDKFAPLIKGAAGISGKYWLCSTCDNNLPYSSYFWAMG